MLVEDPEHREEPPLSGAEANDGAAAAPSFPQKSFSICSIRGMEPASPISV